MNQDDIYNLLLLLLLMSNQRDETSATVSTHAALNDLILTSMLLSSCSGRDGISGLSGNGCACNRNTVNTNTTF